ncbi:MAG TPA: aminotransferase class I/II-fold pyridoxal phosphate-dependent enzyme, partial [bacterium]|nr:aminotransferase class I/II-fold pyridoxal phosphate-dependent enzyme [bacterium]
MDDLTARLAAQQAAGLYRRVRTIRARQGATVTVDDRTLIDFSSNDYLALTAHPALRAAATAALAEYGAGAGAARLMSGALPPHAQLEQALAACTGRPAALLFPSGYQANVAAIAALMQPGDAVFADRLCHASIIDGIHLSGARLHRFRHNDIAHCRALLAEHRPLCRRALLVTESIFSMDGDRAPLTEFAALRRECNVQLMVDEAHAFGVFGPHGAGLVAAAGLSDAVDMLVVTFGKALGATGAAVIGSAVLIDWLINSARGFIFSTAPPPAVAASVVAALALLPALDAERARVLALAAQLRAGLA